MAKAIDEITPKSIELEEYIEQNRKGLSLDDVCPTFKIDVSDVKKELELIDCHKKNDSNYEEWHASYSKSRKPECTETPFEEWAKYVEQKTGQRPVLEHINGKK